MRYNRYQIGCVCLIVLLCMGILGVPVVSAQAQPRVSHDEGANDAFSVMADVDDLVVTVSTDKMQYKVFEPVEVTISVTNTGTESVFIEFPDSQSADFTIQTESGVLMYQWSFGKMFFQMICPLTIQGNETVVLLQDFWKKHYSVQVRISLPAGRYRVDGWMVNFYYNQVMQPSIHGEPVYITVGNDNTVYGTYHGVLFQWLYRFLGIYR